MEKKNVEVMEQLEERIIRAVTTIEKLRSECAALRNAEADLKTEIKILEKKNLELENRLTDLQIEKEKYTDSFNGEEVRKKIDHMLEKFGELQI